MSKIDRLWNEPRSHLETGKGARRSVIGQRRTKASKCALRSVLRREVRLIDHSASGLNAPDVDCELTPGIDEQCYSSTAWKELSQFSQDLLVSDHSPPDEWPLALVEQNCTASALPRKDTVCRPPAVVMAMPIPLGIYQLGVG